MRPIEVRGNEPDAAGTSAGGKSEGGQGASGGTIGASDAGSGAATMGGEPGMTVAEIGSGWGGFAIHLARETGAHVTAVNVSPEQIKTARGAAEAAGVTVLRYEGADHGFVHDPSRPAHRAEDAADAWQQAIAFLSQ